MKFLNSVLYKSLSQIMVECFDANLMTSALMMTMNKIYKLFFAFRA